MANEEMIQKHIDNFLAKIAGKTPVDDTIQNSTEFWLAQIAEQGGGGTEVIANPENVPADAPVLNALKIGKQVFKINKINDTYYLFSINMEVNNVNE